jgi:serine/threonine-protein kinase
VLRLVAREHDGLVARIERRREKAMHGGNYTGRVAVWPGVRNRRESGCYTPARMFFRGQIIGKYKILQTIGSGGFGTVYLAEDTWIDKKVALKVPHKQSVDFGELLREPRLLASLNHPNIVTILTAEKQENVFFIVMEFVPGETLEAIIVRDGALDLPRALDYTCQICNAVDHAHRHGVLHRDLRPSNVLVADRGLLKVADFGTSRFLEIAAHGTTVIGSPPYMAPEQFHGKAVFASDIYSLGVTMYQMLTGTLPYDTPSPADLDRLMRGEMQTGPRLKNPKVPKAINDIVVKALAPDIASRYQRASDVLDDVLAARDSTPRRTPQRPPVPAEMLDDAHEIHNRLKARESPQPRFCWHCRKPLHARSDRCPFCGEAQ